MAAPNNRKTVQLPAIGEFLRTLDSARDMCGTLDTIKSATVRVPPGIRALMRSQGTLAKFWAENRALYGVLAEQQTTGAKRAAGAGA